jgi:hypothetical protein
MEVLGLAFWTFSFTFTWENLGTDLLEDRYLDQMISEAPPLPKEIMSFVMAKCFDSSPKDELHHYEHFLTKGIVIMLVYVVEWKQRHVQMI